MAKKYFNLFPLEELGFSPSRYSENYKGIPIETIRAHMENALIIYLMKDKKYFLGNKSILLNIMLFFTDYPPIIVWFLKTYSTDYDRKLKECVKKYLTTGYGS